MYFIHYYVVSSSVSQPRGQAPPKAHKISLRDADIINGIENIFKKSSATQICIILPGL